MSLENNLSGVLSDKKIKQELERGNIFIHPFNESQLSNSSYDFTLGPYYYSHQSYNTESKLLLPWCQKSVSEYWGTVKEAKIISSKEDEELYKLPNGTRYILLHPGELILAHTNEFIGGVNCITAMMKARSSMGRLGIAVCKDAGWGDVGYFSKWTVELSNFSQSTVPLVVGSRIGQIVFFYTGDVDKTYSEKGAYQLTTNPKEIMENWKPTDMLPKFRF